MKTANTLDCEQSLFCSRIVETNAYVELIYCILEQYPSGDGDGDGDGDGPSGDGVFLLVVV